MPITVLIGDLDLQVVADPLAAWTSLDVTLRFNEVSSGTITIPARPEVMAELVAGRRITVIRDGQILIAGPIEAPLAAFQWGLPGGEGGGEDAGPGVVTAAFADDLAFAAGRLVYPNPAQAAGSQTSSHYVASGAAGTVMLALANLNAGPGALEARQIPHLVMGDGTGVGSSVSVRSRFAPLLDELRSAAVNGGGLGFRIRQDGADLVFEVYEPVDRTGTARFSRGLGNLRAVTVEQSAPEITHAIVGGQGEDEAREIVERASTFAAAKWWRIEQWVDSRNEDTTAGLEQSGDEALAESAEHVRLAAVTVDTPDLAFGTDFGLGDIVTVSPMPGIEIADTVRQAQITATPGAGEHVTVLVGSQEATSDAVWVSRVKRIQRRLGRLETGTDVA